MILAFKLSATITAMMLGLTGLSALIAHGARYRDEHQARQVADTMAMVTALLLLLTYMGVMVTGMLAIWVYL